MTEQPLSAPAPATASRSFSLFARTHRQHFVGIAARSMGQILVERAPARGARKRRAGLDCVSLVESLVLAAPRAAAALPALD